MIKVSVCITTYNLEKYIAQTIDSVLKQKTSFDFEILIGDDCSQDRTRDILHEYQNRYPDKIRLNLQEKNVGVNKQDYDLINMAQGEYIAWLDGDDWWITDDKLEKEARILDAHPEFSCVHTAWRDYIESTGETIDHYLQQQKWERTISGKEYIERFLLKETSGTRLSSIMYRRELIQKYLQSDSDGWLKVPHLQNDFMLFCILSYYAPFYYINEITTCYRIQEASLSHTTGEKTLKYSLGYLNAIIYIIRKFNISNKVKQRSIRNTLSGILTYIYNNDNTSSYINDILKICKSVNYHFPIGEIIIISAIMFPSLKRYVNLLLRLKK